MAFNINGLFVGEIEPTVTVAGCIEIYENIWPFPEKTIEMVNESVKNSTSHWNRAETVGSGPYQNARTNLLMPVTWLADVNNNPVLQNIHNQFYTLLLATTNSYSKRFKIEENFYHEHYHLLKYSEGQEYKPHYDSTTDMGRVLSCVCYLNDDYEGGEIEFPNFKIKIKPQAGMLILFPSNFAYMHVAHPVTKGTKYNLVTWIRDRFINDTRQR